MSWPGVPNKKRTDFGSYKNVCRIDRVKTPLTPMELLVALNEGHYQKFGKYPSDKRLAVGWAQVALENGRGKYTYNYNFGKIKASKHRIHYVQKHRFRAHATAIEGTEDYWNVVNKMCKRSLRAFDAGAPETAANMLSSCGYFGADKKRYGRAMRKLYRRAIRKLIPQLKQTSHQDEILARLPQFPSLY